MKTLIIYWTQEGNQFYEADGDRAYLAGIIVNVSDERKIAPAHWQEVSEAATSATSPGKYPDLRDYGWRPVEIGNFEMLGGYRVVECGFYL